MIYDVAIGGAGPVGLLLACELGLAGVSVLILEQAEAPSTPLKGLPFGMRGLSTPTVEAFHHRGLLDSIVLSKPAAAPKSGAAPSGRDGPADRRSGGHFAGIPIPPDLIDQTRWTYRLPTPVGPSAATTMERIETALAARASALGVVIKRGFAVEDFAESDDGVEIRAGGESFKSRWLVGCGGGRSRVRRIGGFGFVGTDPEFTGYSVQVEIADPDQLRLGRIYTQSGMYFSRSPASSPWSSSMAANFIARSRSRSSTYRPCCGAFRGPMSP